MRNKYICGVILLLFAIGAGEVVCRLLPAPTSPFRESGLIQPGDPLPDGLVAIPGRLWGGRPQASLAELAGSSERFNRLGLRGPAPAEPKPEGRWRLAVVGGSVAFGQGIADLDRTYASILVRRIEQSAPGVSIDWVLGALPGYSTYQSLRLLEETILPLDPDLVVLAPGLDDRFHTTRSDEERTSEGTPPPAWGWLRSLANRSALYRTLVGLLRPGSGDPTGPLERIPPRRVSPERSAALVRQALGEIRATGADCLVVGIPVRPEVPCVLDPLFLGDVSGYRRIDGRRLAGRTTRRLVSPASSLETMRAAMRAEPSLPLPTYLAGRLLETVGEETEAAALLARARRLDRGRQEIAHYNRLYAREAEAAGVPFIDPAVLRPADRRGLDDFIDERLLSITGHARLAEALARLLGDQAWLPAGPREHH